MTEPQGMQGRGTTHMKILVVDDEPKTTAYLKKGLQENGYVVDDAADGEMGAHMARLTRYDLIILDVMLPEMDGWQVLRDIREKGVQTPILFLSARDGVHDRVRGIELGAEDYLVKPFAFSELLARARAIMKRGRTAQKATVFGIADLELDVERHRVVRQGKAIDLTQKEFLLLALLMRRAGDVLSRTLIAEQVWDINFDSDSNVVDVHMRRLRLKVDDPFAVKLIHTVRGIGYVVEDRG